jgi:hypothetical protein
MYITVVCQMLKILIFFFLNNLYYQISTTKVLQLAVLLAIEFAFSIGFRRLEVEVDNQELLGLINLGSPSLAPIGVLVDDIRNWVPLFHFISFSFTSENCNRASRALATEAVSSNFEQVWLEDYPTCLTSFVQIDSLQ